MYLRNQLRCISAVFTGKLCFECENIIPSQLLKAKKQVHYNFQQKIKGFGHFYQKIRCLLYLFRHLHGFILYCALPFVGDDDAHNHCTRVLWTFHQETCELLKLHYNFLYFLLNGSSWQKLHDQKRICISMDTQWQFSILWDFALPYIVNGTNFNFTSCKF